LQLAQSDKKQALTLLVFPLSFATGSTVIKNKFGRCLLSVLILQLAQSDKKQARTLLAFPLNFATGSTVIKNKP
jgi:hypothetical protein